MLSNMLGRVLAVAIDVVITLIVWSIIIWILALIGFTIPGQIISLLEILLALYVIAALLGFAPGFYNYPWLNRPL
jgi:hypothetical protein